jgi:hypothetical protein
MKGIVTYKVIKREKDNKPKSKFISWVDYPKLIASEIKKELGIIEWIRIDNSKP